MRFLAYYEPMRKEVIGYILYIFEPVQKSSLDLVNNPIKNHLLFDISSFVPVCTCIALWYLSSASVVERSFGDFVDLSYRNLTVV